MLPLCISGQSRTHYCCDNLLYAPYPQRCVLLPHCQTAAFSVFHSTGFLVTNRRRIRLTSRVIYTNVHVNHLRLSGDCKPIWFNVGRYHGLGWMDSNHRPFAKRECSTNWATSRISAIIILFCLSVRLIRPHPLATNSLPTLLYNLSPRHIYLMIVSVMLRNLFR